MSNQLAQLKQITADKKALSEQQKSLRGQLEASKVQRKENRSLKSKARSEVQGVKSALSKLTSSIYPAFSAGDNDELHSLAINITDIATELVTLIEDFASACKDPELESEEL
jgi:hypothetical protein